MKQNLSRRSALRTLTSGTAALAAAAAFPASLHAAETGSLAKLKGNIHHSVCAWCYAKLFQGKTAKMSFEDFCQEVAKLGLSSVELLNPDQYPAAKKAGLICAMCNGPDSINYGWNRLDHHEKLLKGFEERIPMVAEAGFPNIITFSGVRAGMKDEEGIENCVTGLRKLAPIAEKNKVTVCVELLNSRKDHKDYMADHTAWGVEVCKRVGSERIKLLYDIYHMQIMEGDLIQNIRDYHQYIGHYHTGGVPGRNEIDDTQETHYPAVMRAILATGYQGYVSQEFIPKGADALAALRRCVEICDI